MRGLTFTARLLQLPRHISVALNSLCLSETWRLSGTSRTITEPIAATGKAGTGDSSLAHYLLVIILVSLYEQATGVHVDAAKKMDFQALVPSVYLMTVCGHANTLCKS